MRSLTVGVVLIACALSPAVIAANISATVMDHKGKPLKDAVITIHVPSAKKAQKPGKKVMDQINKEYVPHVLVVEKGTPVYFPNKDDIRHHVYSFSRAKKFELPLYKGTPAKPIVFDKTGVVKLGCNIHDWMLGYIYVVDTPYYAISDDNGRLKISGIPEGEAKVMAWHSRMKGKPEKTIKQIKLSAGDTASIEYQLKVRKEFRVRRAPRAGGTRY
jgi:plastocyanin